MFVWSFGGMVICQGLLWWLLKGSFKVNAGTVEWYRSSYGTEFLILE